MNNNNQSNNYSGVTMDYCFVHFPSFLILLQYSHQKWGRLASHNLHLCKQASVFESTPRLCIMSPTKLPSSELCLPDVADVSRRVESWLESSSLIMFGPVGTSALLFFPGENDFHSATMERLNSRRV